MPKAKKQLVKKLTIEAELIANNIQLSFSTENKPSTLEVIAMIEHAKQEFYKHHFDKTETVIN